MFVLQVHWGGDWFQRERGRPQQDVTYWDEVLCPSSQVYFNWGPLTRACPRSPLFYSVSFSPLCIASPRRLTLVRKKSPLTHWPSPDIHVKGTERRAQVKPITNLFNMGSVEAMDRTAGQAQVQLSLLSSFFLRCDHWECTIIRRGSGTRFVYQPSNLFAELTGTVAWDGFLA